MWKEQVDESKRKRKRDDEGGGDAKKAKAGSPAKSPAVKSPSSKPPSKGKEEKEGADGEREKSKTPETLVTIDYGRTAPRTAKSDGVDKSLKSDNTDAASEDVRDRCVVMIYDALASDSNACTRPGNGGADRSRQDADAVRGRNRARVLQAHELRHGQGVPRKCVARGVKEKGGLTAEIRTLFLNLKDKGNPALRNEIVLGQMTADRVVRLTTEEMASESMKAMNERIQEQNLFNSKGVGEVQVNYGKWSELTAGRDRLVQVRPLWPAQVCLLPDADALGRRADDCELQAWKRANSRPSSRMSL